MSVFTTAAGSVAGEGQAYTTALIELLGARDLLHRAQINRILSASSAS